MEACCAEIVGGFKFDFGADESILVLCKGLEVVVFGAEADEEADPGEVLEDDCPVGFVFWVIDVLDPAPPFSAPFILL